MSLHPVEEATIRAFISSERRPRYLTQMADPTRRGRFLDKLNHCRDFDLRFMRSVRNMTLSDLRNLGAPETCRLISASAELDGREMMLQEALREVTEQGWGTIICCLPGRLAFYRDELGERELVLERDVR